MGKPLKDWTFGDVKKLCQSMGHCWTCELRSGETACRVADMVRGKSRPMEWEISEQPPLTEPELAICRTCNHHDDYIGTCVCGDSEYRADFTDDEHLCPAWEPKKERK